MDWILSWADSFESARFCLSWLYFAGLLGSTRLRRRELPKLGTAAYGRIRITHAGTAANYDKLMPPDENDDCEFLGWVLIDLDDPVPERALEESHRLGMSIEKFIEMALEEKLERTG